MTPLVNEGRGCYLVVVLGGSMTTTMIEALSSHQREILRLVMEGRSVIEWPCLNFTTPEEAVAFLKINEFDVSNPKDMERLSTIHFQAVDYLERELKMTLVDSLKDRLDMVDLLMTASHRQNQEADGRSSQACALLKTMNIINHIDGRELLYNCPISLRDLFSLVEDKVERTLSTLSRSDPTLLRFKGGRKPKESLITKLLCKRETIAAQIYDRVRYRVVTRTRDDIVKVVLHLFETVLPFNYVIPGASVNQLLPFGTMDKAETMFNSLRRRFSSSEKTMEYSGANYKVCKFVVDIPIRMDKFLATSGSHFYRESLGTLAYVLVEFQIVDEETDAANDSGESSHAEYKKRQKAGVIKRLTGK